MFDDLRDVSSGICNDVLRQPTGVYRCLMGTKALSIDYDEIINFWRISGEYTHRT